MKRIIALLLVLVLCLALAACGGSSSNSYSSNGFVGSDGEYHPDIPEFGDDVNEWMKNNW